MPTRTLLAGAAAWLALALPAAGADDKPEYAEFAKLIHQAFVAQAPKEYEDRSAWGKTIPIPDRLRFPRLRRTVVKVGDRMELPHGTWKRTKVWIDDPNKDVKLVVRDVRKIDAKTARVSVEATVNLHGEREWKKWEKGLSLFGLTAQADAVVAVALECDVAITLNTSKFPPELVVEPKVIDCKLELKDFAPRRVGRVFVEAEIDDELKAVLNDMLRAYEPGVKERANKAIAKGLKEGKGKISADALLKAAPAKP